MEYTHTSGVKTWEPAKPAQLAWPVRLFPSLTDFAFILPAFVLFCLLPGTKRLLSDGDTGWHIRTGEWILRHSAVPRVDLFSFTKPHQPWFAWEWGWDVVFAGVHRAAGLAGVAFVNVCLLCVVSVLLFRLIRRCCGNDVLSFVFTAIAMAGSSLHWLARPHLVSWLFVVVFLNVLVSARQGNGKTLLWLPALSLLWTNLHGGFLIGIVLVSCWALGEACGVLAGKEPSWPGVLRAMQPYLTCAALCTAATFLNPYTWRLHAHVLSYLRDSKLMDNIAEFQSISFHHGAALFFEGMLLAGLGAAWWCLQRRQFGAALLVVLWGHLALLSGRNIPIFMLVSSPWSAAMLRDVLRRARSSPWFKRTLETASEICGELAAFERVGRLPVASALALALMAGLFAAGRPGFESQFDAQVFPIQTVPALPDMVKSHIFTYDQWGDYLIYRYPETKVFMDGRSDFYGHEFVDNYLHLLNADHAWQSQLDRFGIDAVVVKPDAALGKVLKERHDWKLIFDNGSVLVFKKARKENPDRLEHEPILNSFSAVINDGGNGPRRLKFVNHERRSL